jgi:hypothetical protein
LAEMKPLHTRFHIDMSILDDFPKGQGELWMYQISYIGTRRYIRHFMTITMKVYSGILAREGQWLWMSKQVMGMTSWL